MKRILWWVPVALWMVACVPKSDLEQARLPISKTNYRESTSSLSSAQSELSRKPQMPVKVGFRKALTGPGYVAMFETTVKEDFPLLVTHFSKALGMTQQFRLDLSQAHASALGHA